MQWVALPRDEEEITWLDSLCDEFYHHALFRDIWNLAVRNSDVLNILLAFLVKITLWQWKMEASRIEIHKYDELKYYELLYIRKSYEPLHLSFIRITVNLQFKPWGLINYIIHTQTGSNRDYKSIKSINLNG